MKTEINEDSKAKFYFQYYGQQVLILDENNKAYFTWHRYLDNYLLKNTGHNYGYLLLKPLSLITDEDAVEVARLALYHPSINEWCDDDVWIGEDDIHPNGDLVLEVGMRCWDGTLILNESGAVDLKDEEDVLQPIYQSSAVFDYIRSKGYALPWMGLSVNEMMEAGWIKLSA